MTRVWLTWHRRPSRPAADRLRRLLAAAADQLADGPAEIHVLISGDDEVRELNRRWRDRDRPTDVLSFPDGDLLPDGRRLLGEIVVSLDTARREATERGHDEVRELEELCLHGLLHLLGYDHGSDDGEMDALEIRLRDELL